MLRRWVRIFLIETKNHKITYLTLGLVLLLGLFVRVYRTDQILGFYFDQGRDALEIWELWHKGDFFLIGPTTGIAGIFRGPFYYYLIAPFYLLGGGNPVWPAVFLALTTVVAITLLYYLGMKIQDRTTGLVAATIASFSFYIILASRWLSNPTPMLLLSVLLVWMMILVTEGKRQAWIGIAAILGLSLFNFGSSGELFYFPAVLIFAVWQACLPAGRRKNLPSKKTFLVSCFLFLISLLPLVIFDIKNNGILINNIKKFLDEEQTFKLSFTEVLSQRLKFYYDVVISKIFAGRGRNEERIILVFTTAFIFFFRGLIKKKGVKILVLLLLSPMVGLLFFQGNYGNIYDYYITGYYLIFILLFAIVLGRVWKYKLGKILVIYFFYLFYSANVPVLWSKLNDKVDGPTTIAFGNQKRAIDWIYKDVSGKEFSIDVYVPPVIPYAYDYLFIWYGGTKKRYQPSKDLINPLYTLYEVDPPHPERLEAWLARQKGIGRVEKEERFGGIVVQRRKRL